MVNRPEGPTLTKTYRQRKIKEQFLDMGGKGIGGEKQEVLSCTRKDRRDRDFFMDCLRHF